MEIYAWIVESEQGNGELEIKNAGVPSGVTPLVSVHLEKLVLPYLLSQLQMHAELFGKEIRLVRFKMGDVQMSIRPDRPSR